MNIQSTAQNMNLASNSVQSSETQAALMKKALDAQKTEGAAILDLMKQAVAPSQVANLSPGKGQYIDVYA